jgi:uncharacterized circularly permuted ATP-grasp superfamily protein
LSAPTQQHGRRASDEAYRADGAPRPHYELLLAAPDRADLLALRDAAQQRIEAEGASFASGPVSHRSGAADLHRRGVDALAAGLQQRARAERRSSPTPTARGRSSWRLDSVPTLDPGRRETVAEVLEDLRSYVVKPRGGAGGRAVVVGAPADMTATTRA